MREPLETMMSTTLTTVERSRIVPVVVIDDASVASEVIAALVDGGIVCAEIALRTSDSLAALEAIGDVPGFILGAGTVLTPEQLERSADAGARFIVSPGLDEQLVDRARDLGLVPLPGVATATEVQRAFRCGLDVVKFFPADRLGGLGTIRALAAPFTGVRFMPSGGVTPSSALEYLADPAIFAVSGSWMVSRSAIAARDFDGIREASALAVATINGAM